MVSNQRYSIKYQVPGPGGNCWASKGPVNPYQAHRVPAATVTATVAVAYTANIGVTRRPRWSHRSKATTKIHQATPGFPRPQARGESPRVLPWAHHVHIHDASPECESRMSSSIRDRASGRSFPSPHYHEGHAWGSPHAVWAEASTPQTTSFPGRPTEVRTTEVATRPQVRLRVGRLTLGLTVADRWDCSQAAELPAWRHQDLSTSQPLGHTVSRALKQKNLYLGTGPGRALCKSMYTATQGACVFRFASPRGEKTVHKALMG